MSGTQSHFLSYAEALHAIRSDFAQYPDQPRLLLDLCPLILGSSRSAAMDAGAGAVWVSRHARQRRAMRKMSFSEFGEMLVSTLDRERPGLYRLAEICERVFETPAHPAPGGSGSAPGIRLETGMEKFRCRLCGRCCTSLDYRFELTEADYQNWQELGRTDILEWVAPFKRRGRITGYAIWIIPGTRKFAPVCPWLEALPGTEKRKCRIHEVKPEVCRQYPASRKHARMTGCPGFDAPGEGP